MLEIINCEQNSPEWYRARCGKITASSFCRVLAKGEYKTRRTYMLKLAAERIREEMEDSFTSRYTDRGHEFEEVALNLYIDRTGAEVSKCGFMTDGVYGYSPDFLVGEDGLGEIKTRNSHLQADLLLVDKVPPEHIAQLQGGLMVSGRKWIDFISYCPGLPLFIRRVERDEEYIYELRKELEAFSLELNDMVLTLMSKF